MFYATPPMICPACGSTAVETRQEPYTIEVPFGSKVPIQIWVNTCETCSTEGDFLNLNDDLITPGLQVSTTASIQMMLDHLNRVFSNACMERVLQLPFGSMDLWRAGQFTASDVALLRILRTNPGILFELDR